MHLSQHGRDEVRSELGHLAIDRVGEDRGSTEWAARVVTCATCPGAGMQVKTSTPAHPHTNPYYMQCSNCKKNFWPALVQSFMRRAAS